MVKGLGVFWMLHFTPSIMEESGSRPYWNTPYNIATLNNIYVQTTELYGYWTHMQSRAWQCMHVTLIKFLVCAIHATTIITANLGYNFWKTPLLVDIYLQTSLTHVQAIYWKDINILCASHVYKIAGLVHITWSVTTCVVLYMCGYGPGLWGLI
jgi:hypothetical protein